MSLRDELQRPQVKALLIGGGVILLLGIALWFATKKKSSDALAASNPNGLNADASGAVPTVLVLPPPIIQLQNPGAPGAPAPSQPPTMPGDSGPTGILSQPPLPLPSPGPLPIVPGLTGPTGIHA